MNTAQIDILLDTLRENGHLRELTDVELDGKIIEHDGRKYLNLCSNDYLGLTDDQTIGGPGGRHLQQKFFETLSGDFLMSNPSSRLLGGNNTGYELLESSIRSLFPGERRALVLGSGFAANVGLLGALAGKGDLILADKLCHASLVDGARLSSAEMMRFRHNDMDHLESLLRKYRAKYQSIWIVTESIFSMDGDCSPLSQIVGLKHRYGAHIVLDEAHSFGVRGPAGAGYASELGLIEHIDVLTSGLGKALASVGGFVLADPGTIQLLVNRMRTLIYSTALPSINLLWSAFLVDRLPGFEARRERLRKLSEEFTGRAGATQIIPLPAGSNALALSAVEKLREAGLWASAIRHPTVPRGSERVRVSLCASMTIDEIRRLKSVWNAITNEK